MLFPRAIYLAFLLSLPLSAEEDKALVHFERYCFSCHDDELMKGDLDLYEAFRSKEFDGKWAFENLITAKMPPKGKKQPTAEEKLEMLEYLAARQPDNSPNDYRRISRFEYVHAVNDLLGTSIDLSSMIADDRGTYDFDSDRRIKLTKEQMSSYFTVVDSLLESAFPTDGFEPERIWKTRTVKDSHRTYRDYARKHKDGILFSWTRANNGVFYSFFYDHFEPPVSGWYDLTFDAAKMGDFPEDISIMVFAGKYFYSDALPQPQRLLDVISLSSKKVKPHTIRVYLNPGENVSVHCYSKHTWRQAKGDTGAYIKQLTIRGPVYEQWPPKSYDSVFKGMKMEAEAREPAEVLDSTRTALQRIGGKVTAPAERPRDLIISNPRGAALSGLTYAALTSDENAGFVEGYKVYLSDDGENWGEPVASGNLTGKTLIKHDIVFPEPTTSRFVRFEASEWAQVGKRTLEQISQLEIIPAADKKTDPASDRVAVQGRGKELKTVIERVAVKAFVSDLKRNELKLYQDVSLDHFKKHGGFVDAAKVGIKAVLTSPRFLLSPDSHSNLSKERAASLARSLWLSVPDEPLIQLADRNRLKGEVLRKEIDRMLDDPKSRRMIDSFCGQWLNLRGMNKISPSLKLFPEFNELLNHYLPEETESFVAYLIQENLPVSNLIDADFSILNQRLAQHYDVPGVIGQELRKVDLPEHSPRGGLMTMGSILKVTADGFHTSPILRGAWVSKNIVGTTLSPPPESVEVIEPDHASGKTLREQIEEHKKNKTCYACHKSIDPYGFALESFDATGKFRTKYKAEKPHRNTFMYKREGFFDYAAGVDPSGDVFEEPFKDVTGLKAILISDHKKVAYNLARKFFEYTNGYQPTLGQRMDLFAMIPEKADDCGMRDLLIDVLVYSLEGNGEA